MIYTDLIWRTFALWSLAIIGITAGAAACSAKGPAIVTAFGLVTIVALALLFFADY